MVGRTGSKIIRLVMIVSLLYANVFTSVDAHEMCRLADLQACHSCAALARTVNLHAPDKGEYYRGAYWNGLYAAFRLNCQSLGEKLLRYHANPNLGGSSGAFLASLVSAWPHNNIDINIQWFNIVSKYKLDPDWKNPFTGESARAIIEHGEIPLDYPKIWRRILAFHGKDGSDIKHSK